MYPFHVRDSISVNNINQVGDLHIRNIYQHTGTKENIGVKVPNVLEVSLRNLYQSRRQFPEKLNIKMPRVLRLNIKSLLRRYTNTLLRVHIELPQVVGIYLRSYLQKLFSHSTDDTFVVHVPEVDDLHKKNIVDKYLEEEIGKLNIQVPEIGNMYLRNALQTHTQASEKLFLTVPKGIGISGTVKPYIRPPVLTGSVQLDTIFSVELEWDDESITHTGYLLYRDTSPIPADTTLDPIQEFDRNTTEYEDWDLEEDTTYYYRVTPKSIYGRFFSNFLSLYVPLYLRAPRDFEVGYQSLSHSVDGEGSIQSLTAILSMNTRYLSMDKISSVSGEYAYQIFMSKHDYGLVKLESLYKIVGTSKIEQVLRNAKSRFTSLLSPDNPYLEYIGDISLRNISHYIISAKAPEDVATTFGGITKAFIRGTFVILGSAIENRYGTYDSITEVLNQKGFGTREMMLRNPEAFLLVDGKITALAGYYQDDISLRTSKYRYTAVADFSNIEAGPYFNLSQISNTKYTLNPIEGIWGDGAYQNEVHTRLEKTHYFNTGIGDVTTQVESMSGIQNPLVYCILGSNSYGLKCQLAGVQSPYGAASQWSSLTVPGGIRTSVEEDQEFTLFSGYMPPVGFPMSYDTYMIGGSVIPVFRRQVIPGDMTRFTIYERMFKSKEITSGYRPPNGVGIRFSLFVDEE